ncbi:hypothetical protein TrCOL_g11396 [Triparma columacea]|uniref:Uncharacterized protein n=1 Tax=Triparma columacea TaxID=722753 RepID=A0A9W7FXM6_9STRA|nr:hypothetical protein TrCOL_g11396 [Triparma columacea]
MQFILLLSLITSTLAFKDGFLFTEKASNELEKILADCKVEHKIDDASCGELCLSSTIAPFAEKFGGVTAGDCKSEGYTVFDHQETVSMGPFGESTVDIYVKPSTSAA